MMTFFNLFKKKTPWEWFLWCSSIDVDGDYDFTGLLDVYNGGWLIRSECGVVCRVAKLTALAFRTARLLLSWPTLGAVSLLLEGRKTSSSLRSSWRIFEQKRDCRGPATLFSCLGSSVYQAATWWPVWGKVFPGFGVVLRLSLKGKLRFSDLNLAFLLLAFKSTNDISPTY